jgi:hypothetical protein
MIVGQRIVRVHGGIGVDVLGDGLAQRAGGYVGNVIGANLPAALD